jgi:hypothetical protein
MPFIPPPTLPPGDPDRHLKCQEAMDVALQEVALAAIKAGWDKQEVATALVELADAHVLAMIEDGAFDEQLARFLKGR